MYVYIMLLALYSLCESVTTKCHFQTLKSACLQKKRPHTSRHVSNSLEEKWIYKYFSRWTRVPSESKYLSSNGYCTWKNENL